ncbi:hypothetical protein F5884DRAFT_748441 [Xylogone sp. PMI_703]|nr:hypothetical protein F5884DRAFT_748441 [Xylogone sp. PMI_703]
MLPRQPFRSLACGFLAVVSRCLSLSVRRRCELRLLLALEPRNRCVLAAVIIVIDAVLPAFHASTTCWLSVPSVPDIQPVAYQPEMYIPGTPDSCICGLRSHIYELRRTARRYAAPGAMA